LNGPVREYVVSGEPEFRMELPMSFYGRVFARIYDPFLGLAERAGMRELRRQALTGAHGRVLEIGAGTGLNLPLYPSAVTSLTLADPEPPMVAQLRKRAPRDAGLPVVVVEAPAEQLPFGDGSFDTVVCTLVLCTVADPAASLREIGRVLAPGGRLLFVEHVRAAEARLARRQDRLHDAWLRFAYGCHCNRDTAAALRDNGFDLDGLQQARWRRMPPIVQPLLIGIASQVPSTARP
jgi:ubiquinone/menaquinone biosynthesis C-methylase UbiE